MFVILRCHLGGVVYGVLKKGDLENIGDPTGTLVLENVRQVHYWGSGALSVSDMAAVGISVGRISHPAPKACIPCRDICQAFEMTQEGWESLQRISSWKDE